MPDQTQSATCPRILVVDDERLLHGVFSRFLGRHGMEVTSCTSATQALGALEDEAFDLVVTDFQMQEMDGLELLAQIRECYPSLPVVMITGHASIQHAVRALERGAVDYLPKPFTTDVLLECVQRHLNRAADGPALSPRPSTKRKTNGPSRAQLVGTHPSVIQLRELLTRIGHSTAPVFAHGESGTGKEVVARLVHEQSDRANGPFVPVNFANLPSELVESHLFGHKKGAFTGAIEDMAGAFARANGGTLLLDEVTEITLPLQAKLLRVLQEEEFQQVGSDKTTQVNVRVVATSIRDLRTAVADGTFREDLYHQLAVFPLFVPPLRERQSDIALLADHFVEKFCTLYGLPGKQIAPALLHQLEGYPWPGNVRELSNMVHRGVVLAANRTTIERGDVINDFFTNGAALSTPAWLRDDQSPGTLDEMERLMIMKALRDNDNNQERAAKQLGITARTIRNKLKRYREDGMIPSNATLRKTG